ncbi:MAG: ABC transporter permease [Rhizobiaceae bacterium]|nr:ABC transporter permease [Rhizobiaceae bacterium]
MQRDISLISRYGLVFAFIAIIVLFSVLRPDAFLTTRNFGSIMSDNAVLMLIALGIMVPLVVGQFDLSPGFVASLGAMLTAGLLTRQGLPWPAVLVIVVLVGCAIGLLMGILVGYLQLNSLIVSLGVGSAISGFVLLYSNGEIIFNGIPASFTVIGQTRLFGFLPLPFIYAMIAAIVIWYVLTYLPVGRRLYAIGGSQEASRLIGININKYIAISFVVSSGMASLAGFVQVARLGAGHPTSAQAFLLPAFAAAFLGATAIRPGFYNIWGTVIAVFLVGAGTTGLFMLGAQAYVQPIFNGAILVLAVTLSRVAVLRRAKALARAAAMRDTTPPAAVASNA